MSEHTYPSAYPPGAHWAIDEAWEILDRLAPGAIPDDIRFFLAGMIGGTLMRIAEQSRREGRGEALGEPSPSEGPPQNNERAVPPRQDTTPQGGKSGRRKL